jgi:alkanesulfonate monooxygenase
VIQILKQCWSQESVNFSGDFYQLNLPTTDPVKPYQQNGGPLLYFGGISPAAKELCAEFCDVFLMWPETEKALSGTMQEMASLAGGFDRRIDFGLRIHMIVRETESEAREAAQKLISKLDPDKGEEIKNRAQDNQSAGVKRQDQLRAQSKDDYIEDLIWSGIGRARSGCASAIVGNPDQVYAKIQRYIDMGIRAFILSGYPHMDECEKFAELVLPRLNTIKLNVAQGRLPGSTPETPLTFGKRI